MHLKSTLSVLAIVAAAPAFADCDTVTFSDVGWTDIGSWSEVASEKGDNVAAVAGDGNIIRSTGPFIGAAGVKDLIIVATGDAVLVAKRDDAQQVRALVEELKKRGREDLL